MYFDTNNQYARSMSQPFLHGFFEWIDTNIDVTTNLQVDFEYLQKDVPFCSEHIIPKTIKLSETAEETRKLMVTLYYKNMAIVSKLWRISYHFHPSNFVFITLK